MSDHLELPPPYPLGRGVEPVVSTEPSQRTVNGHEIVRVGGRVVSPWVVGCCPRARPWGFPTGGRVFPRLFGQGLHPLSVECVLESDGFALGDDDVGVVEEPVNERAGDGFVHELIEAGRVKV